MNMDDVVTSLCEGMFYFLRDYKSVSRYRSQSMIDLYNFIMLCERSQGLEIGVNTN